MATKKARTLRKLTSQPARFLATIQVAITLSGFLGSAFAADNFSDILTKQIMAFGFGIKAEVVDTVSVVIITLILSYFTLVFGELVPKRITMKKSEELAMALASLIALISKVFAPIVWLLTVSTNGLLKILGINPDANDNDVSEEDIRLMVDAGLQNGTIASEEKKLIRKVFEFNDITVADFATHRTEVDLLYTEDSAEDWAEIIRRTRHTIYPVCNECADNIIGLVNIKDYYNLKDKSIDKIIENILIQPIYVPEHINADVLFREMKKSHVKFAVIIDEYGGFTGIVTINDLVEQIVGSLDDNSEEITLINDSTWEVTGIMSLKTAEELFETDLPVDDYDTFGGFIFGEYGSIPDDGTTFENDSHSLHINVLEISDHRIIKAVVTRKVPAV